MLLMGTVSFFDLEIDPTKNLILDVGCIRWDGTAFHETSVHKFIEFIKDSDFIVGHNIFKHDLRYLHQYLGETTFGLLKTIDTLYVSPLLFPSRPYHNLLKDDKLQIDELNNPLNDSIKAKHLFFDQVNAFQNLDGALKKIFFNLLKEQKEFSCFFKYLDYEVNLTDEELESLIQSFFATNVGKNNALKMVPQLLTLML